MERTPLITGFVCLATAGATVDGREITAQQLHEMAESYDPKTYTANIWREHNRWWNFGQVVELEVREEDGKTKLYGRLAPNLAMIEYNKAGQGLFLSIEIATNFANTGKAYLGGLAVTDSPASLGTTQLMFSHNQEGYLMSNFEKSEGLRFNQANNSEQKKHFFSSLFNWLFNDEKPEEERPVNNDPRTEQEPELVTKEDFKQAVIEAMATFAGYQQSQEKHAIPKTEDDSPAETVSREEFNALQKKFDELSERFNTATQTEVTPLPNGAGGEKEQNNQHFNVDFAM